MLFPLLVVVADAGDMRIMLTWLVLLLLLLLLNRRWSNQFRTNYLGVMAQGVL
jgi:hypothetical protein